MPLGKQEPGMRKNPVYQPGMHHIQGQLVDKQGCLLSRRYVRVDHLEIRSP